MYILSNYTLLNTSNPSTFRVVAHETPHCPDCCCELKVCGIRKRTRRNIDGSRDQLIIRRLRCPKCNHIHHELPDCLVPYRRYSAEAVEDILSGNNSGSCELSTIRRIILWFSSVMPYLQLAVQSMKEFQTEDFSVRPPFFSCFNQPVGWLRVLVKKITNSGKWPHTRYAF